MSRKESRARVGGDSVMAREDLTWLESTLGRPTARFNPLGFLWRWRYELALALGLPAIVIALTSAFGRTGALAAVATVALIAVAVVLLPPVRHRFVMLALRITTPHRLRSGFAHARIQSRSGRLPFVVRTTSQPFGERVFVWCPSGVSAEDLYSARALLEAASWASHVRIARDARYSHLVIVDVIRQPGPIASKEWLTGHKDNGEND